MRAGSEAPLTESATNKEAEVDLLADKEGRPTVNPSVSGETSRLRRVDGDLDALTNELEGKKPPKKFIVHVEDEKGEARHDRHDRENTTPV